MEDLLPLVIDCTWGNNAGQTEIHTTELLLHKPCSSEDETAIEKMR
jgi:hypothetical protein